MKQLEQLKLEASRGYVPNTAFAYVYLALGQKDEAIDSLEKDIAQHSSNSGYLAVETALDDLRGEPRFNAMLKRMNLPE
ncbi:MAG TPA: hypothetical protein VGO43_11760 [Pyrinomonadaceae bacterium]|jgi:hypothetical protein|nr:hypothetical protein [Pyrinomonadaceae bacterium]